MTVVKVIFRKPRWRLLRSYLRVAQKQHACCKCVIPIFPGDEYFGEVRVLEGYDGNKRRRNWLNVRKCHETCPIDPEEEALLGSESEFESSRGVTEVA